MAFLRFLSSTKGCWRFQSVPFTTKLFSDVTFERFQWFELDNPKVNMKYDRQVFFVKVLVSVKVLSSVWLIIIVTLTWSEWRGCSCKYHPVSWRVHRDKIMRHPTQDLADTELGDSGKPPDQSAIYNVSKNINILSGKQWLDRKYRENFKVVNSHVHRTLHSK